ncbi:MAG: PIN domain-containing protein [Candidatus Sumerlaeia bacterium]|nr:PIN domain-containing protein [Candidatus Sumerlaeia bacterium]
MDLNVIMDFLQKRMPFFPPAARVLNRVFYGRVVGVMPVHMVTTLYYLVRRQKSSGEALDTVNWLLNHFEVAACNKADLLAACSLPFADFEDAVSAVLAGKEKCECIVSRNLEHFRNAPIRVLSPEQFLAEVS